MLTAHMTLKSRNACHISKEREFSVKIYEIYLKS